ncbi:hypothetical protein L596_012948 [Steinernema carpocapsae]|uniref:E3 ubiquitin-protein ligase hrd-1 n=1 Tax=Steinernema carpocapsae TaxID=34508 RepID=A0A4U5NZ68_STECR|nr:hypothetical protein L596_012948 [Steinernema carpocapsae]
MIRPSTAMVTLVSFVLTALTISNAYLVKKQFYPAVVYMTKSNASLAVMYIQIVVLGYLAFQLLRRIFFGQLRAAESEHISEKLWHALMETCLAFTVFRDELSYGFALQFLLLLFVKCFHWLSEDRVDYMERSPIITITFHTRIISLLAFLSAIDSYCVSNAYFYSLKAGVTAQMVFGFEYAVMMTMVAHVAIKYVLHMHDLRSLHPWENKAVYLLYAELFINFIRCILYFMFAFVMWKVHAVPLFAIRPFYMTIRAFHKAVNDVILSRRAIHAMNNLFPLATEEELSQGDNTCIICREEMTVLSGAKKLPCNHIFHPNCLRSWFQRQQTCPTCRTNILSDRRTPTPPNQGLGAGNGPQIPGFRVNFNGNNNQGPAGGANVPPVVFPFMAHQFGFPAAQAPPGFPGAPPAAPGGEQPAQHDGQQAQQPNGQPQPVQMPQIMAPFMPPFMMPPPRRLRSSLSLLRRLFMMRYVRSRRSEADGAGQLRRYRCPFQTYASRSGLSLCPVDNDCLMRSTSGKCLVWANDSLDISKSEFNGMTDEELRAMEGEERSAIERRIQTLRNIACLLDAAMYQFGQYTAITDRLNRDRASNDAPAPNAAPTEQPEASEASEASPEAPVAPEEAPAAFEASQSAPEAPREVSEADDSKEQPSTTSGSQMSPEEAEKLNELRRRRLERFGNSSSSSSSLTDLANEPSSAKPTAES